MTIFYKVKKAKLFSTEDYWAVWLGLGIIAVAILFFIFGGSLKGLAVTPGKWSSPGNLLSQLWADKFSYLGMLAGFGVIFSISIKVMKRSLKEFVPGFLIVFMASLAVFCVASFEGMKDMHIGAPLLALIIGLVIGNLKKMPDWFRTAMRTEYYIKTGIVLLGATLPLTLIYEAGGIAFLQASIVSLTTWFAIYFAATRIFKLDPQFGAVLGAGGAVCGVSASIAVGGAVKAKKDHIAIGIGVVSIWAIIMVFMLVFLTKFMIVAPEQQTAWWQVSSGEAGAWVGTSEYADAAGFAVVAEIAEQYGDGPIHAFTLMKVIGRDIWIGIWAFILAIVSCFFWEKQNDTGPPKIRFHIIWDRFPKFVLGFLAACIVMSLLVGMSNAGQNVPAASNQNTVVEQSHQVSWLISDVYNDVVKPVKKLRSWLFVFCFLCIGLSTRFKDLAVFGMKPFWAFTAGVAINVPLGFFLSTVVFEKYWQAIQ